MNSKSWLCHKSGSPYLFPRLVPRNRSNASRTFARETEFSITVSSPERKIVASSVHGNKVCWGRDQASMLTPSPRANQKDLVHHV